MPPLAKGKVKKRIKLNRYKEELVEDISLECSESLSVAEPLALQTLTEASEKCSVKTYAVTSSDERLARRYQQNVCFQVSLAGNDCDSSAVIVDQNIKACSPPPPPAPTAPKTKQRCQKHTKCHCDLLSLGTSDFYSVAA